MLDFNINTHKKYLLALVDPDKKNDIRLKQMIEQINNSSFNAILIGGSSIEDNLFERRVKLIKSLSKLPLISFPGSSNQISKNINTILYLNLISGRNPKYLIEEQVNGAVKIFNYKIKPIPTAYILIDGGINSSVSIHSNTKPLDNNKTILSHVLAGVYMGNQIIYLDSGSGANNPIDSNLIKYINKHINIPIMVGGGIKSKKEEMSFNYTVFFRKK